MGKNGKHFSRQHGGKQGRGEGDHRTYDQRRDAESALVHGVEAFGTVKMYDKNRGFGFIMPDAGGPDVFVHAKKLKGLDFLNEGDKVRFIPQESERRPGKTMAVEVAHA